jgi:hypothetical protein
MVYCYSSNNRVTKSNKTNDKIRKQEELKIKKPLITNGFNFFILWW